MTASRGSRAAKVCILRWARRLAVPAAVAVAFGCASKLKHDLTAKGPHGGDATFEALDTSSINFTDLSNGETVNLAGYMQSAQRDFLLLAFGSKTCAACNRKDQALVDQVIDKAPLFLTDAGRRFEIVGVNTDTDSPRQMANYLSQFPFIRWSDPHGTVMVDSFMPANAGFSVPLVVMISKGGIAWRILPDDHVTVEEMMDHVQFTLGLKGAPPEGSTTTGGDGGGSGGGDGGGTGTGTGSGTSSGSGTGSGSISPNTPSADLARMAAGRLKTVAVNDCAGHATSLDAALGADADYRFVSIVASACDSVCQDKASAQRAALSFARTHCSAPGKTCSVAQLFVDGPTAAQCAAAAGVNVYKGGAEFYSTFRTHFDWSYQPSEGPPPAYALSLPAVAGPLILGFARDGTLAFSSDSLGGALAQTAVADALKIPSFGGIVAGPNFPLFGPQMRADGIQSSFKFADWRRQSQYSVVAFWGTLCSSCAVDLQRWNAPGELAEFCTARPKDCQTISINPEADNADQTSYDAIVAQGRVGTMGLALDPMPKDGPSGTEYLKRFFEGYMSAEFYAQLPPDQRSLYRAVIYDREGKILGVFVSGAEGNSGGAEPVLSKLKDLLGASSPH